MGYASDPEDGAIRTAITDTIGDGSGEGPEHELVVEPGGKFGRYVAIERLGSGAMGVVYAAYDPKLDRKIAVKLLHPHPVPDGTADGTAARLIREARALAKLSHPNVVAIYDADTLDESVLASPSVLAPPTPPGSAAPSLASRATTSSSPSVFIAMEYIDGMSLAAWTRAGTRSWRDVVEIFASAGRGLAAAHAVGLVHRDFKPDNVLVGNDGRVRVVDFGIARAPGPSPQPSAPQPGEEVTDDSADSSRTGASVGTPAYMAPEQHLGREVDARSDQFSFCVALHEALYGRLPFGGTSLAALALNVTQGNLREPPPRSAVPSWLRRVVVRGLSSDPSLRFASMGALLHELDADPARRRRRAVFAGAGAATIGLLGWAAVAGDRVPDPCADGARHLVGVWDPQVRSDVEHAFVATGVPFARRSWDSIATGIDGYTDAWVAMRREACEATQVHGEQSSDLLDRRMACLQGRLRRVGALTRVFAHADAEVVAKSIEGLDALPMLEPCADAEALLGAEAPPVGERKRAVDDADLVLAEAEALRTAGNLDEARRVAGDALAKARAADAGALEARALRIEAKLALEQGRYEPSERALFEALAVAERVGADPERAVILLDLGFVLTEARQRYDEADRWLQQADAVLQRIHGGADQRAELAHELGLVRARQGRHAEAIEHFDRAMAIWRESEGDHTLDLARVRNALGATLDAQGRHDDALAQYQTALALLEQRVGPDHPHVAVALNNIGVSLKLLRRFDEARVAYERALELRRAIHGPDHPKVAATLMNLANVLVDQQQYDGAMVHFAEALAIQERTLGSVDPAVGKTLFNMGVALQLAGRLPAALDHHRRALDIELAALGEDDPELAYPRSGIGTVLVELGRGGEAIEPLEAALAVRQLGGSLLDLGELRFALARALGDCTRARELAQQAALDYRSAGDGTTATRIDAWLLALK